MNRLKINTEINQELRAYNDAQDTGDTQRMSSIDKRIGALCALWERLPVSPVPRVPLTAQPPRMSNLVLSAYESAGGFRLDLELKSELTQEEVAREWKRYQRLLLNAQALEKAYGNLPTRPKR